MKKLRITITMQVGKSEFANALAGHYWTNSEEFNNDLKKKEAKEILKAELHWNGIEGIEKRGWEGAREEFVQPFEDAYNAAKEWIEKKYPFLD